MANPHLLVLEMSTDRIKIALVDVKRNLMRAVSVVPSHVSDPSPERVKALKGTLQKLGRSFRSAEAHLIIDSHQATIKLVRFPSLQDSEVEQMVGFQAVQHIPFSREEIIVDYEIIAVDQEGYAVVMMIIVPRQIIDEYLAILKKAGIVPRAIRLASQAVVSAYSRSLRPEARQETHCVIDVDFSRTSLMVVHQGKLIFTRSLEMGAKGIKDAAGESEAWNDRLISDLRMTLMAYQRQSISPAIQKIVFSREGPFYDHLCTQIQADIEIPCGTVSLKDVVHWVKDPQEVLKDQDQKVSFSSLIGGGIQDPQATINLLPEEWRKRQEGIQGRRQWFIGGALAACIVILISTVGYFYTSRYHKEQKFLEQALAVSRPRADELKKILDRLQLIRHSLTRRHMGLQVLSELYQNIPDGVLLSQLNFENGKLISIRGASDQLSIVFDTVSKLEQLPLFDKVEIKYATVKGRKGQDLADFQIDCYF